MKYLIASTVLCLSLAVHAQDLLPSEPRYNEGNLFTVKLVPAAGRLEVHVVGKEVARIKREDITIGAEGRTGKKTWTIETIRSGDRFFLKDPLTKNGDAFDLKLRVKAKDKSEEFDFPSVPAKP